MKTCMKNFHIVQNFGQISVKFRYEYLLFFFHLLFPVIGNTVAGVWSENGSLVYSEGNTEESIWPCMYVLHYVMYIYSKDITEQLYKLYLTTP